MKPTSQIPLLGGFFQGFVILAVLLTFPASGGTAEPKRSRVPSPLEMAAILREGSDDKCSAAFDAILNDGPMTGEMAEVLARGMKPRSRRIQKSACILLGEGRLNSNVVVSALIDAAASESLDLSRNAAGSLRKIGISADTAAMIAKRAGELCRPEPTLYLLGNLQGLSRSSCPNADRA